MGVQYSGTDLQSQRFEAKDLANLGLSSAGLQGSDSSVADRYGEGIGTAIWKSLSTTITRVLVALIVITVLPGMIKYLTGVRTGPGTLCSVFVLTLMAIMVLKGTVARATIGTLGCPS